MPIEVRCQCGKRLKVPDKFAGKKVACPGCSEPLSIPALAAADDEEPEQDDEDEPEPPPAKARPSAFGTPPQFSSTRPSSRPAGPPDVVGDQRYSLREFVQETAQKDQGHGFFELESPYMLEVNLDGMVWTKMGSMVAYVGQIKFTREGVLEQGIGKFLKKAVSGEGTKLTKAEGRGTLYLADSGKRVSILNLQNEAIFVNGNDLLALEQTVSWDIKMMKSITGMLAGGLFNVKLSGSGMIAITSHFQPMTLRVLPDQPVTTDPNATIAWSGNLTPEFKKDISLKTFFGRGSGESIQMLFQGNGFVVVQPYEEVYFQAQH
jgi:uncharacterized protein (AIM24 family)